MSDADLPQFPGYLPRTMPFQKQERDYFNYSGASKSHCKAILGLLQMPFFSTLFSTPSAVATATSSPFPQVWHPLLRFRRLLKTETPSLRVLPDCHCHCKCLFISQHSIRTLSLLSFPRQNVEAQKCGSILSWPKVWELELTSVPSRLLSVSTLNKGPT